MDLDKLRLEKRARDTVIKFKTRCRYILLGNFINFKFELVKKYRVEMKL